MQNKKNFLFDLDGTITDPFEGITNAIIYALDSFGINVDDPTKLKKFIGPPLRNSFKEYYGFTQEEAERGVEKYREFYSKEGVFQLTIYDGIEELFSTLKDYNKNICIATSKPIVYANRILEKYDLIKYIDFVGGSELDGTRDNKVDVIKYVIENEKLDVAQCVMVGDRHYDINGARALNMDSIGVTYGYGSYEELREAKATWIVNRPVDIWNGEY